VCVLLMIYFTAKCQLLYTRTYYIEPECHTNPHCKRVKKEKKKEKKEESKKTHINKRRNFYRGNSVLFFKWVGGRLLSKEKHRDNHIFLSFFVCMCSFILLDKLTGPTKTLAICLFFFFFFFCENVDL